MQTSTQPQSPPSHNDLLKEDKTGTKTYEIGSTSTLVDLNQNLTNFIADFKIYLEDKSKSYKVAVVDQTHIDNAEIDYKDVTGDIGATVSWDKDVYKNHYIALKSSEPLKVNVDIILKEIPKQKIPPPTPHNLRDPLFTTSDVGEEEKLENKKIKSMWFKISMVCIGLIAVILIWKFVLSPSPKVPMSIAPLIVAGGSNPRTQAQGSGNPMPSVPGSSSGEERGSSSTKSLEREGVSDRIFSRYKNYSF